MNNADERMTASMYKELKRLANDRLKRFPNQSLYPTELVNHAYERLARQDGQVWDSRTAFFKAAARVMRFWLIDHIKAKMAAKRPQQNKRVDLTITLPGRQQTVSAEEILALDASLTRMKKVLPKHTEVVMLRYFAGMTIEETASALEVSVATVQRYWRFARAWLRDDIGGS